MAYQQKKYRDRHIYMALFEDMTERRSMNITKLIENIRNLLETLNDDKDILNQLWKTNKLKKWLF